MGGIFLYVFFCYYVVVWLLYHHWSSILWSHSESCVVGWQNMLRCDLCHNGPLIICWFIRAYWLLVGLLVLTSTKSMLAHTDAGGHSRNVGLIWDWETSDQNSCCALNCTQTITSLGPNELDGFCGQSNDFHQDFISAWSLSSWKEITAGYCIPTSNYNFNLSSVTQENSASLKKNVFFFNFTTNSTANIQSNVDDPHNTIHILYHGIYYIKCTCPTTHAFKMVPCLKSPAITMVPCQNQSKTKQNKTWQWCSHF